MHRSAALLVVAALAFGVSACSGFGRSPDPVIHTPRPTTLVTAAPTLVPEETAEDTLEPIETPVETAGPVATQTGTDGDLVGVWRGREPTELETMSDIETILLANGTFSSLGTDAVVGSMTRFVGTWEVINMNGSPMLRFNITDWDPKQWCGPTGHCTPILPDLAQNKFFRFTDADTLLLWNPGCTTRSCQYVYTRS